MNRANNTTYQDAVLREQFTQHRDGDDVLKNHRLDRLETIVENSDKFYEKQKSKYLQEHDSIDERMIQTWWENFRREQDSLEITDNTTNEQIFYVVFRNSYP